MNKQKLAVLIVGTLLVTGIYAFGFTRVKGAPLQTGDIVYYLSNNRIYSFTTLKNNKVALVYSSPVEGKGEKYQINGLSCGPKDTLIFHVTHTTGLVPDYSNTRTKTTVVIHDIHSGTTNILVDLGERPAEFPALSPDESKLSVCTSEPKREGFYFTLRDMKTGELTKYEDINPVNKLVSLGPNDEVVFEGLNSKTGKPQIYLYNMAKKAMRPWKDGMMPHISPSGRLIAYTSLDQYKLIISDRDGKMIQSFGGHLFKDLNGWIGENKVLFTIGHFMYSNRIGIADIKKNKIYEIKVPTKGEINGICYRSILKSRNNESANHRHDRP